MSLPPSGLFRKSALDRLATPEELDSLMSITSPRGWAALAAVVLLVLSVAVWGFLGRIPVQVRGHGIFVRRAGVHPVLAPAAGSLAAFRVRAGEVVRAGQPVAVVETVEGKRVEVRSARAGRVVEMLSEPGVPLPIGARVATVEQLDRPLEAVLFVPLADAAQLRTEMRTEISPTLGGTGAPPLDGRIAWVGQYPASREQLLHTLRNEEVVQLASGRQPVVEVHVQLARSAAAADPAPGAAQSGTLCTGRFLVGEQSPAEWLFPAAGVR